MCSEQQTETNLCPQYSCSQLLKAYPLISSVLVHHRQHTIAHQGYELVLHLLQSNALLEVTPGDGAWHHAVHSTATQRSKTYDASGTAGMHAGVAPGLQQLCN